MQFKPEAYNQRDIVSLKAVSQWRAEEEQIHLQQNRILQPGFMHRDPLKVLADAKLLGEEWLTDICCPSVMAAVTLHIGKEMVVNYKVEEAELNIEAHKVYNSMLAHNPEALIQLEGKINDIMKSNSALVDKNLENLAIKKLEQTNANRARQNLSPLEATSERIEAAKRVIIDIERKKVTDELVSKQVKAHLASFASSIALQKKTINTIDKAHDYSFLGAAGSGKSTIARQFLTDDQKADYIVLATDNYRAFIVPGTEKHEANASKDIFSRTQDMAYMVKELVQSEIEQQIKASNSRPNVICDCITLDGKMQELLSQGTVTSVVAAYRGEPGYVGIAERADNRARDIHAAPADKGRFVNTTALFEGHANASARLLSSIPKNTATIIYDTNVERGAAPIEIATIDSKANTMQIKDLRVIAEFLNKRNINTEAINQVDLIYNSKSPLNTLVTHPENKAKSILDLVPGSRFKAAYNIQLTHTNGQVYAELVPEGDKVKVKVLDKDIFYQKARADTIEASVLRAVVRQTEIGSLENSLNAAFEKGDKTSFEACISKDNQAKGKFAAKILDSNDPSLRRGI